MWADACPVLEGSEDELSQAKPRIEAPEYGGRVKVGPVVSKFLVGSVPTRTKGELIWALSQRETR